jgi:hypothetical protein
MLVVEVGGSFASLDDDRNDPGNNTKGIREFQECNRIQRDNMDLI